MIRFCAQMEIKGSRERVWEYLMKEFPPEHRRPGKIDLNALEVEEPAKRAQDNPLANTGIPSPRFPDMEILDWDEGRAFVIQVSQKPYLQSLIVDAGLQEVGGWEGDTMANIRLEVKPGCLLGFPVRVIFRLFQTRFSNLILQSLAAMRYEIETGKTLEHDQEFKGSLERIQIVRCK